MPANIWENPLAGQSIRLNSAFLKNTTATFSVYVLLLLISIANSAVVARWLGPEGKGMLALALLTSGVLSLVLSGGVGVANVYFAGSRRFSVSQLTRNSFGLALLGGMAGAVLIVGLQTTGLLGLLVPGVPTGIITLALLAFPVGLLTGYLNGILQGLQRIIYANAIALLQGVLTLGLTLLLVAGARLGLLGAVLANLGAAGAALLLAAALVRQAGGHFAPRWDPVVMRPILAFGLRGYIGNLLQFFNYRLDSFIVNYFLGPAGVGIYGTAVALAELLWHLPNAVSFVIFPKAAATQPEVMNRFTPRVFRVTLGLTALGGLGLALVGRWLIRLIYTSTFDPAYVPLLALLPGVILLGGAKSVFENRVT
jgi:O-antigen/teichoic acid export membrane protein